MKETLFVEVGFGSDQHGQDVTKAAVRACRNAIGMCAVSTKLHQYKECEPSPSTHTEFNSLPAIKKIVPGGYDGMKLRVQLAVPEKYSKGLDMDAVRKVFPYGRMLPIEVRNSHAGNQIGKTRTFKECRRALNNDRIPCFCTY